MVWLVSFSLQALGAIWIFITIIAAIAIAISVQQAGSISVASEYAQLATAAYFQNHQERAMYVTPTVVATHCRSHLQFNRKFF